MFWLVLLLLCGESESVVETCCLVGNCYIGLSCWKLCEPLLLSADDAGRGITKVTDCGDGGKQLVARVGNLL